MGPANLRFRQAQRPGMGGEMMTSTETWSVEGGNLVIEGSGGRGGPQKRVYKKSS